MLHKSVITALQTDTYIDELLEIFLKFSMKTVQVHLIYWDDFSVTKAVIPSSNGARHRDPYSVLTKLESVCASWHKDTMAKLVSLAGIHSNGNIFKK